MPPSRQFGDVIGLGSSAGAGPSSPGGRGCGGLAGPVRPGEAHHRGRAGSGYEVSRWWWADRGRAGPLQFLLATTGRLDPARIGQDERINIYRRVAA